MSGFLIDFHSDFSVSKADFSLLTLYYFVFVVFIREVDIRTAKKYLKKDKSKLSYLQYNIKKVEAIDKLWPSKSIIHPDLAIKMRITSAIFIIITSLFLYITYKTWF